MLAKQIHIMWQKAFSVCFCKKRILSTYPFVALSICCITLIYFFTRDMLGITRLFLALFPSIISLSLLSFAGFKIVAAHSAIDRAKISSSMFIKTQLPALALVLVSLSLFIVTAVFFLIKQIPLISFILHPFSFAVVTLLSLAIIALLFLGLFSLFVWPSFLALSPCFQMKDVAILIRRILAQPLSYLAFFFVSLLPLIIVSSVMVFCSALSAQGAAGSITMTSYVVSALFSSVILTPCVLFFFECSAHSFLCMQRDEGRVL